MTLGERILKYRKKAGISQEELADKLNVTRQSISLWETDQTLPSLDNLIALAELFNISMDELCGLNTEKTAEEEPAATETAADVNEDKPQCFASAKATVTPQVLKDMRRITNRNVIVWFVLVILSCAMCIFSIVLSNNGASNDALMMPIAFAVLFVIMLIRLITYGKSQSKKSLKRYPNLVYRYLFYSDHFVVKSTSDTSQSTFTVKYDEIKKTVQNGLFIYVMYDNNVLPIESQSISVCPEVILNLLKLGETVNATKDPETKVKPRAAIRSLLIAMFVLSLLSIFIALFVVQISVQTSPIPDFGFTMIEHMWKFFLIIPLPLTSTVLGIVYRKKGYKCKKNVIAGVIMCVLLPVYGSFTFMFNDQIGHEFKYVRDIEYSVGIDLPDNGYVSYKLDKSTQTVTSAMVKFDDKNEILNTVSADNRFKRDTNSIPSNFVKAYDLAATSNYDFFLLYDKTCGEFNNAMSGNHLYHRFIYIAYSIDKNIMYVTEFVR